MTLMTLDARALETARPLPFPLAIDAPAIAIRDERAGDVAARETLLDESFGPGRHRKTSERLREGRLPARGLALVATDRDRIVGTIRLWHVNAGGAQAILLGPLAVAADLRSLGLGARMISEALFRAVLAGHKAVILVGDAPYYARFGFARAATRALAMPGPVESERFLGLELIPGSLGAARGLVVPAGELAAIPRRERAA